MTILTPEVRALLKRMDAEEALQKAVELGLEAAAKLADEFAEQYARQARGGDNTGASDHMETAARDIGDEIRALKEQK